MRSSSRRRSWGDWLDRATYPSVILQRAEPIPKPTAEALRTRPKTRSLVLGNLALAYLRQRQFDAATATLHEAIDLLENSRGGGGLTVVFSAGRELYPWRREPAVQDVQDQLLALVARA